jgi:hypothetical protein
MTKKIVCALAVGVGLSLMGCPPDSGKTGGTTNPSTETKTGTESQPTTTSDSGTTSETPKTTDAAPATESAPSTPSTPAATKPDLSDVKVGQKYYYTMTNPGAPAMKMVYEVKEVGDSNVKYEITTLMDMGQG